jgi:transcriptional regulator with AAA-type ATPase domain
MARPRTSKSALFRLIQQSPLPVYAVASNMRIVYCNPALCRLTGQDDEALTELTCVYRTDVDSSDDGQLAAGLCPPPDSFCGMPVAGWVTIPRKPRTGNPQIEFRQATFVPTHGEPVGEQVAGSTETGVLVFVHGAPQVRPTLDESPRETPDPRQLHAAISQMQYESSGSISVDRLVGHSPAARRIRQQVRLAGQSAANVTIVGPRGSGRRHLVPLIHFANGPQMAGPLIPLDGRVSDRESVQETVKELYRLQREYPDEPLGRLFLRDVDQLTAAAQEELSGFLRLPDFRLPLIATALPDAATRVDPDLWQSLATLTIELPPLAERRQDIPLLAQAIVEQFNTRHRRQLAGIEEQTMARLVRYSWPGELEEMTEALDEACRAATLPQIRLQDLPSWLRIALRTEGEQAAARTAIDLDSFLADIEEELIRRAVIVSGGNKSEAARLLKISRPRLLRRLATANEPLDSERRDQAPAEKENP